MNTSMGCCWLLALCGCLFGLAVCVLMLVQIAGGWSSFFLILTCLGIIFVILFFFVTLTDNKGGKNDRNGGKGQ